MSNAVDGARGVAISRDLRNVNLAVCRRGESNLFLSSTSRKIQEKLYPRDSERIRGHGNARMALAPLPA
jgi:hypothetical protein